MSQEAEYVAELEAENKRLRAALIDPSELTVKYKKGEPVEVEARHWAVKALVHSFADTLGNAPNLVIMDLGDNEHGYFSVTIQRRCGKSTSDILAELRARIAELEEEVDSLNKYP